MKTSAIIGILVLVVVVIAGGYAVQQYLATPAPATTRTIVDSTGANVTIPVNVTRVAALRSGIVEMMAVLGATNLLVAVDDFSDAGSFNALIAPEVLNITVPVSMKTINHETLISLDPDIVLVGGYGRLAWVNEVKSLNLTVAVTHFEEIGNFTRDLTIIGQIVNKQARAQEVCSLIQATLDNTTAMVGNVSQGDKVKVYFASHDAYHVYGGTTFEGAQIVTANGINVATEITSWLPAISAEQLLVWNPDVIFTLSSCNITAILTDPQLQSVNAVKNGRVYAMPEEGWDYGSLRSILAIEWMASKMYPAQFSGVNMTQVADSFFMQAYGIHYGGPDLN